MSVKLLQQLYASFTKPLRAERAKQVYAKAEARTRATITGLATIDLGHEFHIRNAFLKREERTFRGTRRPC